MFLVLVITPSERINNIILEIPYVYLQIFPFEGLHKTEEVRLANLNFETFCETRCPMSVTEYREKIRRSTRKTVSTNKTHISKKIVNSF